MQNGIFKTVDTNELEKRAYLRLLMRKLKAQNLNFVNTLAINSLEYILNEAIVL